MGLVQPGSGPAQSLLPENVPLNGTVWEYTRECGALGKPGNQAKILGGGHWQKTGSRER